MNNDVEYECVPSALFNTYGIKKDNSCQNLPTIQKGGLDYVKSVLKGHCACTMLTNIKICFIILSPAWGQYFKISKRNL